MSSDRRLKTFSQALNEALSAAMAADDKVVLFGEDIAGYGGKYKVTAGLARKFGEERVIDTPLIEDMLVGIGLGLTFGGYRPVIEFDNNALLALAMDDIYRASTWHFRYHTIGAIPIVVRISTGWLSGIYTAPENSTRLMSWFQHIPGLTIIAPFTPFDAKGLLTSALRAERPVLFFEDKPLYFLSDNVPEKTYTVPIGKAQILRQGRDATIVSCGFMTQLALQAAATLAGEHISAEVLDLRTVVPLDHDLIMSSAEKTGHVVIAEEGILRGGIGAEIGMNIIENNKNIRVRRVAVPNVLPGPTMWQKYTVPTQEAVVSAVRELLH